LRLSSASAQLLSELLGDGGVGRVGVTGVVDAELEAERPKRGSGRRKGSRLGGDFLSVMTGSGPLVKELNFSKVPLDTMGLDGAAASGEDPTALSSVLGLSPTARLIHFLASGWLVFSLLRLSSTCFHS